MIWLGAMLGIYLILIALVYAFQEKMLFVGASWGQGVALTLPEGVSIIELPLPSGETFRTAVSRPTGEANSVMVFFVGNGEDLRSGIGWASELSAYGLIAMVVEYPGYGDSGGHVGRTDFEAAADSAMLWVEREAETLGIPAIVGGSSIGSFMAVYLAAQGRAERMLLRAPPTSIRATARHHYPWLPTGLLLRDQLCFDSLALAAKVTCPSLVIHGDRDRIIPAAMGRDLARSFGVAGEFVSAAGYGHNDLSLSRNSEYGPRIASFLRGQ